MKKVQYSNKSRALLVNSLDNLEVLSVALTSHTWMVLISTYVGCLTIESSTIYWKPLIATNLAPTYVCMEPWICPMLEHITDSLIRSHLLSLECNYQLF